MSLNQCDGETAEEVGYDKVADLAKNAGIASVKATPAMALGAYDASPVDMTAAYTTFANGGVRLSAHPGEFGTQCAGRRGDEFRHEKKQVSGIRASPTSRTNMMESVINNGLGYYGGPTAGFTSPAAGKTGSSHDGWFAGLHVESAVHRLGGL